LSQPAAVTGVTYAWDQRLVHPTADRFSFFFCPLLKSASHPFASAPPLSFLPLLSPSTPPLLAVPNRLTGRARLPASMGLLSNRLPFRLHPSLFFCS
jgi:hypothetical protein